MKHRTTMYILQKCSINKYQTQNLKKDEKPNEKNI